MQKSRLLALYGLVAAGGATATAQVFGTFEASASGTTAFAETFFRQPSFSGSTGGFLNTVAPAPNTTVITDTFPGGNAAAGTRALLASFEFKPAQTNPWLRLTSNGANPTIDFNQYLQFQIYTDRPIQLALGVRETGTSAAIGASGGTTGGIEFIGATGTLPGSSPVATRTLAANTWTTIVFDINAEPLTAFAGATANGILDLGTTGKGVLENLAIVPLAGDSGIYNVYFDNFEVTATPVPEPSTYAFIAGLGLTAFAAYRRQTRKA